MCYDMALYVHKEDGVLNELSREYVSDFISLSSGQQFPAVEKNNKQDAVHGG